VGNIHFRFGQFTVKDTRSTMRVGTDAMLLGSWAGSDLPDPLPILDIGTGCGVLALMMAQKSYTLVHAVEPDEDSCTEAVENFNHSPWKHRIQVFREKVQDFAKKRPDHYGYIFSNPPFFDRDLPSPKQRKNLARHQQSLPLSDLFQAGTTLLHITGRMALIVPFDQTTSCINLATGHGLYLHRSLTVTSKPGKSPFRSLMEFGFNQPVVPDTTLLTLLDADGRYSSEYLELTCEYHSF